MTPREHSEIARAVSQWAACSADDPARFDSISQLIVKELNAAGTTDLELLSGERAAVAGWLQESVIWDLLVLRRGNPVLVVAYTSLPLGADEGIAESRANEVIGVASDTRMSQAHGNLPGNLRRAHIHIQELTTDEIGSRAANLQKITPGTIVAGAGSLDQAAVMCARMRDSGLYDLAWTIGVTRDPLGFAEPSPAVGWNRFASDLRSLVLPG